MEQRLNLYVRSLLAGVYLSIALVVGWKFDIEVLYCLLGLVVVVSVLRSYPILSLRIGLYFDIRYRPLDIMFTYLWNLLGSFTGILIGALLFTDEKLIYLSDKYQSFVQTSEIYVFFSSFIAGIFVVSIFTTCISTAVGLFVIMCCLLIAIPYVFGICCWEEYILIYLFTRDVSLLVKGCISLVGMTLSGVVYVLYYSLIEGGSEDEEG